VASCFECGDQPSGFCTTELVSFLSSRYILIFIPIFLFVVKIEVGFLHYITTLFQLQSLQSFKSRHSHGELEARKTRIADVMA
jgi:hypothetical protein